MPTPFDKIYWDYDHSEWYWKILKLPLLLIVVFIHILFYFITLGNLERLIESEKLPESDQSFGGYKKYRFGIDD